MTKKLFFGFRNMLDGCGEWARNVGAAISMVINRILRRRLVVRRQGAIAREAAFISIREFHALREHDGANLLVFCRRQCTDCGFAEPAWIKTHDEWLRGRSDKRRELRPPAGAVLVHVDSDESAFAFWRFVAAVQIHQSPQEGLQVLQR